MTSAEARFNKSLRPRKPEGSLGRTAQDVHLDSHTAPEQFPSSESGYTIGGVYIPCSLFTRMPRGSYRRLLGSLLLCQCVTSFER